MRQIVNLYNEAIKSYTDKGWIISPSTMHGSYTNVSGYTDLIKPGDKKNILRVFMSTDYALVDNHYHSILKILVKKYDWDGKFNSKNLWLDCGDPISCNTFYELRSDASAYTDSPDDIIKIRSIRDERYNNNRSLSRSRNDVYTLNKINKLSANFIDNIMERINAVRGFKRATASCIKEICLYKVDGMYNYATRKRDKVLRASVSYSFNGKSGILYIGG
jgi:hypothetical protein